MKALILDAGNSLCKLFSWQGDHQRAAAGPGHPALLEALGQWDSPREQPATKALTAAIQNAVSEQGDLPLVVTSVVPEVSAALSLAIPQVILVNHSSDLPFRCAVDDPAAVGSDRFCNMAAAVAAGFQTALVVDVGTATTFDVLQDNVFLGGLIAPGPEFSLNQLGGQASRLKKVPFQPAPLSAAPNTEQALTAGSWHCGLGGIESCIAGLLEQHGPRPVFLTGGLGHHLSKPERWHDPHFTLRGAAALAGLFPI